jgi:hypothetical protein
MIEDAAAARTSQELTETGALRPDRRRGSSGDLTRVRRGVYTERQTWRDASADARYSIRIAAAALALEGRPIFSHESALRLLDLPSLAPWPEEIHLIAERRTGGRSQLDIRRHCLGLECVPTTVVDRLTCTTPARSAIDIALTRSFDAAVVVADAVLARDSGAGDEMLDIMAGLGSRYRGISKAWRAFQFADGRAESPGETLSRVEMARLGFVPPQLQVPVRDGQGLIGRLDFCWPDLGIGGEFDGRGKYLEDRYTRGRTAAEIVMEQKERENRMRRRLTGFARWDTQDLRNPARFAQILRDAGVPFASRGT